MQIKQVYTHSPLRNFSYFIISEDGKEVFCIDPFDAAQVEDVLYKSNLKLTAIINTHEHPDHICGNRGLVDKFKVPVFAHENAEGKIPGVDRFLKAGELIKLGHNQYMKVMDTPGHTFAHLCLKLVDAKKEIGVITGDTMFNAGVGNCHNGGDPQTLYTTIASQFFSLDDHVRVYPGHEYWDNNLEFTRSLEPSNKHIDVAKQMYDQARENGQYLISDIGLERKVNTFFRLENQEIKENLKISSNEDKTIFLKLRELRNNW